MKQPSNKAAAVAIAIWGCIAYTIFSFGAPIVGETVIAILFLPAFFALFPLISMCQKFFDDE